MVKHTTDTHEGVEGGVALDRILDSLRQATGTDFSGFRRTTIMRRVTRRIGMLGVGGIDEYAELLDRDDTEIRRLFEDILIGVTSFFRNPGVFDELQRGPFRSIIEANPTRPIRMWVPGCASGEEVYSLGISLQESMEELGSIREVQLFGTDLSEAHVFKARAGIYSESIESQMSETRLTRFFERVENGWRITKRIREMCVFARHDLTRDPPFTRLDLLSCRNLLIYWDRDQQDRLIPLFHYALRPSGFLLLGGSESADRFPEYFTPIDRSARLYQRQQAPTPPRIGFGGYPPERLTRPDTRAEVATDETIEEAARIVDDSKPIAAVLVDDRLRVVYSWGRLSPYFTPSAGPSSLGLARVIVPELVTSAYSALQEAGLRGAPASSGPTAVIGGEVVRIRVEPMPTTEEHHYLLMITEHTPSTIPAEQIVTCGAGADRGEDTEGALRDALEELAVSNEELRTTTEELGRVNEDLSLLNKMLTERNDRLQSAKDDLENVLDSIDIPLIVLDEMLRIRITTTAAEEYLHLRPSDVGRPLPDLTMFTDIRGLAQELEAAHRDGMVHEQELQDRYGTTHLVRLTPYRRQDGRSSGVVIAFLNVEKVRREALEESANMLKALNHIDTLINSTMDSAQIMRHVVDEVCRSIGAESAILYEKRGDEWVVMETHGIRAELAGKTHTDASLPYLNSDPRAEPMFFKDAYRAKGFDHRTQRELGRRTVLAMQLTVQGEVVGVLAIGFKKQTELNDTRLDFARRLAASVSVALESARAYATQRNVADRLQEALLTLPAHVSGIEHAAVYRSATVEARVGGDFYDLFELEGGHVAIVIGDVSGKGLDAATLTALARSTLRAHAVEGGAPCEVLSSTNRTIFHFTESQTFLTAFFGILNPASGTLRYATGGHPHGVVVDSTGARGLPGSGPLVGAFDRVEYEEFAVELSPDDVLVLYTDGIVETRTSDGLMYGTERLLDVLGDGNAVAPRQLVSRLMNDVMSFSGGELSDDVALLAVKLQ